MDAWVLWLIAAAVFGVGEIATLGFFLAAIVAGVGFGAAFQGALRSVAMVAGPHERAGVITLAASVLVVGPAAAEGGASLLSQLVAVPVLEGGSGGGAGRQPLENAQLPCDRYTAYWDGKVQSTSQDAGRGIYLYSLEVDGKSYGVKRMFLRR